MNIKKLYCMRKELSPFLVVDYYATVCTDAANNRRYGICIEASGKSSVDTYISAGICRTSKEAYSFAKKLAMYTVTPINAEECIDELLAA